MRDFKGFSSILVQNFRKTNPVLFIWRNIRTLHSLHGLFHISIENAIVGENTIFQWNTLLDDDDDDDDTLRRKTTLWNTTYRKCSIDRRWDKFSLVWLHSNDVIFHNIFVKHEKQWQFETGCIRCQYNRTIRLAIISAQLSRTIYFTQLFELSRFWISPKMDFVRLSTILFSNFSFNLLILWIWNLWYNAFCDDYAIKVWDYNKLHVSHREIGSIFS